MQLCFEGKRAVSPPPPPASSSCPDSRSCAKQIHVSLLSLFILFFIFSLHCFWRKQLLVFLSARDWLPPGKECPVSHKILGYVLKLQTALSFIPCEKKCDQRDERERQEKRDAVWSKKGSSSRLILSLSFSGKFISLTNRSEKWWWQILNLFLTSFCSRCNFFNFSVSRCVSFSNLVSLSFQMYSCFFWIEISERDEREWKKESEKRGRDSWQNCHLMFRCLITNSSHFGPVLSRLLKRKVSLPKWKKIRRKITVSLFVLFPFLWCLRLLWCSHASTVIPMRHRKRGRTTLPFLLNESCLSLLNNISSSKMKEEETPLSWENE